MHRFDINQCIKLADSTHAAFHIGPNWDPVGNSAWVWAIVAQIPIKPVH